MDKFASNIKALIEACTPYAWLLPVVGLAIIGVCYAIPSDGTHNFAKKHWAGVIIGTLLVAGCVYFGDWIFKQFTF